MNLKSLFQFLGLAMLVILTGCSNANRTVITGSWDNPDVPTEDFTKILVLGLSSNQSNRAVVEQAVANELQTAGFNAVTATQTFNNEELTAMKDDRDMADRRLGELGFDGILIMSLLDVKEDTYYVPGTVSYHPTVAYPYYGGYYGYWGHTYTSVYSPGYYDTSVSVFLESNLYELGANTLVWSAQSKTEDPSSVSSLANAFSRVLVDEMVDNKVLVAAN